VGSREEGIMNSVNRDPPMWVSLDRIEHALSTAAADPDVKFFLGILQIGPLVETILADILFEWALGFLRYHLNISG
jgi:hypothetical protein